MNVAGAVLAGGKSLRMGRTKALIEINGRAMADRVIDALRDAGIATVIVYGGDPHELDGLSAAVVTDAHPGTGPLGGVLGALQHYARGEIGSALRDTSHTVPNADDGVDAVLVLACDLAFVTARTLRPLLSEARRDPARPRAVWVARTDRMQPMCALWSIDAIDAVKIAFETGERAVHRVIAELDHVEVAVDAPDVVNINTPDELP